MSVIKHLKETTSTLFTAQYSIEALLIGGNDWCFIGRLDTGGRLRTVSVHSYRVIVDYAYGIHIVN